MNITFIGGGNMADALISGLLRKGREFRPENLRVVEINPDARRTFETRHPGVKCFDDASKAVREGDVILFAVKPQDVRIAAKELRAKGWTCGPGSNPHLVVSIAAGVTSTALSRWLNTRCLVRAMPNTPALIGEGITGLYKTPDVSEQQMTQAETILAAVGKTVRIDSEEDMNTVTAVSGSGPAYVFWFIEQLAKSGEELGLSAKTANKLAIETVLGASRLAAQSDESLAVLRERVTSKGGTTEAALKVFEEEKLAERLRSAIRAAKLRGAELGEQLDQD